MLNIYGSLTGWTTKITSLLKDSDYKVYDSSNYDEAPADLAWVIGLEDGYDRLKISETLLEGSIFHELFKGCDDLEGVTVGKGLVIGCCSLIRPGTVIGNQVYVGAGSIIDINCTINDGVTIGDNVTVCENVSIPANTNIPSGTVVTM